MALSRLCAFAAAIESGWRSTCINGIRTANLSVTHKSANVSTTAAETLTHRNGIYEVLNSQPIQGLTRGEQRAGANWNFLQQLEADPVFARQLGDYLGVDDLAAHMRSGKVGLKNPIGTEWHHPINDPDAIYLLRRQVHRDPALQPILHPENIGGFSKHFGN